MSHRYFEDEDQASFYSRARPVQSPVTIAEALSYLEKNLKPNSNGRWNLAVDVGAGSGQCTKMLHDHFDKVYGFDISAAQINEAKSKNTFDNVEYQVSASENLPLKENCVDLITACQCMHWFNFDKFFKEVGRVLKQDGVLAVVGYPIPTIHAIVPEINFDSNILFKIYRSTALKPYFEMDRLQFLDNEYQDIQFPFRDVTRSKNVSDKESTALDCIEYVRSWSGYRSCFEKDVHTATGILNDLKDSFVTAFNEKDLSKIRVIMRIENIVILSRK